MTVKPRALSKKTTGASGASRLWQVRAAAADPDSARSSSRRHWTKEEHLGDREKAARVYRARLLSQKQGQRGPAAETGSPAADGSSDGEGRSDNS